MLSHPVHLAFDDYLTRKQMAWLARTSVPLRSITFFKEPPFGLHGWSAAPGNGNSLPERIVPGPMPALEVTLADSDSLACIVTELHPESAPGATCWPACRA